MKTVVVYKSKAGFVKKYAEWIAQELSADIFEASNITIDEIANYDTVIYGGGLYAVGINGVKLIIQNLDRLKGKKIVVFASGASPDRKEIISEVMNNNFTSEQQEYIRFFYLRGGFDYGKLKPFDKVLMTLLKWKLKRKEELSPDEKGMLAAYEKPADFTQRKNIREIIDYITS
ncbi:flavodoxin domain-containing protein [Petroclostridium sp. X23]|uniref:flavodoxin domain-containing protein n=1 Tax=Petroclostridium sp. X23 TaxID=3045146 RepID=UPI0024AD6F9D|nr:flavodoxin domain-containing protein [Petroclostridium sp. X23]WHH57821.1 flavodoxin domain-containing protein [Petroclostridium sp. X23]